MRCPSLIGAAAGLLLAIGAPPAVPAAAATRTFQHTLAAAWVIANGCREDTVTVSGLADGAGWQRVGGSVTVTISQRETCGHPWLSTPVLELTGSSSDVAIVIGAHLADASLSTRVASSCRAFVPGACERAPYSASEIVVGLAWRAGATVRSISQYGRTCRLRFGPATGAVWLGTVNVLGGQQVASDRAVSGVGGCRVDDLDLSFGASGAVVTALPGAAAATAVAVQPDGRIVVAGWASASPGRADFAVVRYEHDGAVDATFGRAGVALIDFHGGDDRARAVVLQPDGRMVVAGVTRPVDRAGEDMAVTRLNADGTVDTGFAGDGRAHVRAGDSAEARDVALGPDGAIVLAGSVTHNGARGPAEDFGVARLTAGGAADPSFGSNGVVVTDVEPGAGGGSDAANAVAVRPDGRIVAGGHATVADGTDLALARYRPDGSLDPTFGGDGVVTTDVAGELDDIADLVVDAQDRVTAAGTACRVAGDHLRCDPVLARVRADGGADATFGRRGLARTSLGDDAQIVSLARLADGRIVAGALGGPPGLVLRLTLLRYRPDGQPDCDFGNGYPVVPDFPPVSPFSILHAIALDARERIVVVGESRNRFFAARIRPRSPTASPQC